MQTNLIFEMAISIEVPLIFYDPMDAQSKFYILDQPINLIIRICYIPQNNILNYIQYCTFYTMPTGRCS